MYVRINLIVADRMNESLEKYISRETSTNLSRVEGIMNILVLRDTIVVPPLMTAYFSAEVGKYSYITNLILKLLGEDKNI